MFEFRTEAGVNRCSSSRQATQCRRTSKMRFECSRFDFNSYTFRSNPHVGESQVHTGDVQIARQGGAKAFRERAGAAWSSV